MTLYADINNMPLIAGVELPWVAVGAIGVFSLIVLSILWQLIYHRFLRQVKLLLKDDNIVLSGDAISVKIDAGDVLPNERIRLRSGDRIIRETEPTLKGTFSAIVPSPGEWHVEYVTSKGKVIGHVEFTAKAPEIKFQISAADNKKEESASAKDDATNGKVYWRDDIVVRLQRSAAYRPGDAVELRCDKERVSVFLQQSDKLNDDGTQTITFPAASRKGLFIGDVTAHYMRRIDDTAIESVASSAVLRVFGPSLSPKIAFKRDDGCKFSGMYKDPLEVHVTTSSKAQKTDKVWLIWSAAPADLLGKPINAAVNAISAVECPQPTNNECTVRFSGTAAPSNPGEYCVAFDDGSRVVAISAVFHVHPPVVLPYCLPSYKCILKYPQNDAWTNIRRHSDKIGRLSVTSWRTPMRLLVLASPFRGVNDELWLARRGDAPRKTARVTLQTPAQHITMGSHMSAHDEVIIDAKNRLGPVSQCMGEILIVRVDAENAPRLPGLYTFAYVPDGQDHSATLPLNVTINDSDRLVIPVAESLTPGMERYVSGNFQNRPQKPCQANLLGRKSYPPWSSWGQVFAAIGPRVSTNYPSRVVQANRITWNGLCYLTPDAPHTRAAATKNSTDSPYVFQELSCTLQTKRPLISTGLDSITLVPMRSLDASVKATLANSIGAVNQSLQASAQDKYHTLLRSEVTSLSSCIANAAGLYQVSYLVEDPESANALRSHETEVVDVVFLDDGSEETFEASVERLYIWKSAFPGWIEVARSLPFPVVPPVLRIVEAPRSTAVGTLSASEASGKALPSAGLRVWVQGGASNRTQDSIVFTYQSSSAEHSQTLSMAGKGPLACLDINTSGVTKGGMYHAVYVRNNPAWNAIDNSYSGIPHDRCDERFIDNTVPVRYNNAAVIAWSNAVALTSAGVVERFDVSPWETEAYLLPQPTPDRKTHTTQGAGAVTSRSVPVESTMTATSTPAGMQTPYSSNTTASSNSYMLGDTVHVHQGSHFSADVYTDSVLNSAVYNADGRDSTGSNASKQYSSAASIDHMATPTSSFIAPSATAASVTRHDVAPHTHSQLAEPIATTATATLTTQSPYAEAKQLLLQADEAQPSFATAHTHVATAQTTVHIASASSNESLRTPIQTHITSPSTTTATTSTAPKPAGGGFRRKA